jgi:hypothetical protein
MGVRPPWVSVGELALLLGADLEERGRQDLGWSAIVGMTDRPAGKAGYFKIPHHGSSNGHHDSVWTDLLMPEPIAVLTPWSRGSGLPTMGDVARISALSAASFSTSNFRTAPIRRRPPAVERQIRETVGKIRSAQLPTGQVRLRNGGQSAMDMWCIETMHAACHLQSLLGF